MTDIKDSRIFVLEKMLENMLELFDDQVEGGYCLVENTEDDSPIVNQVGNDIINEARRVLYEDDDYEEEDEDDLYH